jgi:hypothetical protein
MVVKLRLFRRLIAGSRSALFSLKAVSAKPYHVATDVDRKNNHAASRPVKTSDT